MPHALASYSGLTQALSRAIDCSPHTALTFIEVHQGKEHDRRYRCWNTDDQTGEGGCTAQVFRVVVARRDDDEEREL